MYLILRNLLENKFTVLYSTVILLVPFYTYKTLIFSYRTLRQKYEEKVLFYKRHNCVVMYSGNKGMSGWPPHIERIKLDFKKENCLDIFHEPILYFIDTAEKSLDVAFMLIGVNKIYAALMNAQKKGVKIRVLLNFQHCSSKLAELRQLLKEGIQVLTYISHKPDMSSIMHHKFIIKDYSESSGFVLTGSLNLTETAFLNNYEDIIFTFNQYVVKAFHDNFEDCWTCIQKDNENLINKTVLLDANLA